MKQIPIILILSLIFININISAQVKFIQLNGKVEDVVTHQPVADQMMILTCHTDPDTSDLYTYSDTTFTDEYGLYWFPASVPYGNNPATVWLRISTLDCMGVWQKHTALNDALAGAYFGWAIFSDCNNLPGPCENQIYPIIQGEYANFFGSLYYGQPATYQWDFGDGHTDTSQYVTHLYDELGQFTVALKTITADSCIDNSNYTFEINDYSIPPFTSTCHNTFSNYFEGLNVHFSGSVEGNKQAKYYWDFGDGVTAIGPNNTNLITHTYSAKGLYNVVLKTVTTEGCVAYSGWPLALVDSLDPAGCDNYILPENLDYRTITLRGNLYNGDHASYFWALDDGTTASTRCVTHTYAQPGIYHVILQTITNNDNCMDYTSVDIDLTDSIFHGCSSYFTYNGGTTSGKVRFKGSSYSPYPVTFSWNFGDPVSGAGNTSSLQSPVHSYTSPGNFTVTLITTDSVGCTSVYLSSVSVLHTDCESSFTTTTGNGLYAMNFQASTTSQYTTEFYWSFGDGTNGTGQNISHNYAGNGIYQVTLNSIDSVGCESVYTENVWVADTIWYPPTNCENELSVSIIGLTVTLTGYMWNNEPATFYWDLGDGNTYNGPSVTHTYPQSGTYMIKEHSITSDSCVDITIDQLYVSDSCKNTIQAHGVANLTMSFWGHIENGYEYTASYFWDWGDGTTSTGQYPLPHKFPQPGMYNVVLKTITTDSCVDFSTYTCILIDSIPNGCHSYFTATAGNNLYEIHFEGSTTNPFKGSATSLSPATFLWDFGDPASGANNSSTLQNPDHTFSAASTYQVTLTTTDSAGCSSAFSAPVILSLYSQYYLYGQVFAGSQTITDCKVQLFSQDYTGNMNLIREVFPDSADFYKFDTVSSGIYHILAIPDQGTIYSRLYLPTYFGNAFLWENSTPVILGQPSNPYSIHLVYFDSISGGDGLINGGLTTGGKSFDVGNQEILILDINNNPVKYMFSQADGSFSFEGLPYGEYKIYPVITGVKTYPVTVILSAANKEAMVIMKISGQSVAGTGDSYQVSNIEKLYPNPASNQISFSLKSKGEIKIQIIGMSGKKVVEKQDHITETGDLISLSVSELKPGLYILIIQDENGTLSSRRFVKN